MEKLISFWGLHENQIFLSLTWKTLFVCERQLSAFHISNSTKHVNVMVVSRLVFPPEPSSISLWNTHSVPKMIIPADNKTLTIKDFEIIGSFTLRGFCLSTSWSTGSTPKDWAGGPSIIMLIHNICMAFSGFAMPINVANAIKDRAAIDVLNWNRTKFLIL